MPVCLKLCILISLFWLALPCAAEEAAPTARGMFAILPPSIFESTRAGLEEQDKQALLQYGATQFWEIAEETPDTLLLEELPFRERSVAVRLFHNEQDGSTEVAIGTLGDPVCTLELWRRDQSGRVFPVATPPEPSIGEFFSKRRRPPLEQQNSVMICLGLDGLRARPLFWSEGALVEPRADKEIRFEWNGREFERVATSLRR